MKLGRAMLVVEAQNRKTENKEKKSKKEKNKIKGKIFSIIFLSSLLSSCAYSDKFNCPISKGLNCQMLRTIDQKIDSGEIDKTYSSSCKGKKCKKPMDEAVIPHKPIKATISTPKEEDYIIIEDQ